MLFFQPPAIVYGMVPAHEPFRFVQGLEPQTVKEGDKVIFVVELSHNKEVNWLRGRGRCKVGSHYECVSVGLRRSLIIHGKIYRKAISIGFAYTRRPKSTTFFENFDFWCSGLQNF